MLIKNLSGATVKVPTDKKDETFSIPTGICKLSPPRAAQFNDARTKNTEIKALLAKGEKGGLVEIKETAPAAKAAEKAPAAAPAAAAKAEADKKA